MKAPMLSKLATLQNVVAPLRPSVEPLYLRSQQPLFYDRSSGRIEIAREQEIDFDSYVNSLFEAPLLRASKVQKVYLHVAVAGEVDLAVFRASPGFPDQLVARERLASTRHVLPIELGTDHRLVPAFTSRSPVVASRMRSSTEAGASPRRTFSAK
jgi:hypothetical protein